MKRKCWKFCAKVCSDGRLYAGCWAVEEVVPKEHLDMYYITDEVPDDIGDGHNYIWDGVTLTYSPAEKTTPDEEPQEEEVTYT